MLVFLKSFVHVLLSRLNKNKENASQLFQMNILVMKSIKKIAWIPPFYRLPVILVVRAGRDER